MDEFTRSQCLYHPAEFITNFCKEKTCLMPLCPTCICSHLELHLKGGKSNPQFDNISDSFSSCSKEIKVFSEKFDEGRNQLNSIQRTIIDQKKELSDLIYKTKVQVRELVEATFQQLEKDLEAAIDRQNQSLGLHLPENLDALQKGIIDIGSKLREMNGDLRTDRSLSTLITFNHETRASLEKYQGDIFKEIRSNEDYSPVTTVNTEALNRLKQAVSQIISLKFNFPQGLKQQQKVPIQVPLPAGQPVSYSGQAQIQNQGQIQGHLQGQIPVNPSLVQQGQSVERHPAAGKPSPLPMSSSLGSRNTGVSSSIGVTSPPSVVPGNKPLNPSYISGGLKVGESQGLTTNPSGDIKYRTQGVTGVGKEY